MKMYLKSAGMSCFPILSSFLVALFFLFSNIAVATEIEKEHFLDNFCHTPNADKKRQIENNKSVQVTDHWEDAGRRNVHPESTWQTLPGMRKPKHITAAITVQCINYGIPDLHTNFYGSN